MRMQTPRTSAPPLCHHKPSGRAHVNLDSRRRVYPGKFGTKQANENYRRFIAEWSVGAHDHCGKRRLLVLDLIARYQQFCREHYRQADGTVLQEAQAVQYALKPVRELYADLPAEQFGPLKLKAVREAMIARGWNRTYVNQKVGRVKRMFKWATENELIPPAVWHGLHALDGLRTGRCQVREPKKVAPVANELVEATKKHVSRQVAAQIDFLLLTGARPSELLSLRPCDIDRSESVWQYRPRTRKNAHRGQDRVIYLGTNAQAVLKEFLLRPAEAFLFSPREAEAERHTLSPTHRRADQKPNVNETGRRVRDRYDARSFYRAIPRACDAAFPPPEHLDEEGLAAWRAAHRWFPYQLRHNAATLLATEYGIEAAQTILGHKKLDATQIYAERDREKAKKIIAKVG
ncbi:site-specific integrase [bacterium]|nr:site-specific integrase [bacterium]